MTDWEKLAKEFWEYYNGNFPDPEHHPRIFAYYVKLFKYYKGIK
jgi:hypothetical protein